MSGEEQEEMRCVWSDATCSMNCEGCMDSRERPADVRSATRVTISSSGGMAVPEIVAQPGVSRKALLEGKEV